MRILIQKVRKTILKEDLRVFFPQIQSPPLFVDLAGVTNPNPAYVIRRELAGFFVIELVTDGVGYVSVDDEVRRVEKGDIYFLSQGVVHHYYADKDEPFSKIFLNVSGKMCEQLVDSYGLTGKHFFDGKRFLSVFERIVETIHSDMRENEMQSALQGIFLEILCRLSLAESEAHHSVEALRMKRYLDENIHRLVSANELSRRIFRSPDYSLKLFKREFGITPYAYQINRKMELAKYLLSKTGMSVEEISESLGYCDVHYFSNLFRDKCGIRPSGYRKSMAEYN